MSYGARAANYASECFSWWWLGTSEEELNRAAGELLAFADLPARCTIERNLVDVGDGNYLNELELVYEGDSSSAAAASAAEDDPPLVLLHGYGASAAHWYRSIGPVARSCEAKSRKVIALDWLGCGRSSRPAWPLPSPSVARRALAKGDDHVGTADAEAFFVESLEAWRKAKGHEQMCLAGHSLGGYLIVAYAERFPERVSRLILVSPVGVPHAPSDAERSARFDRIVAGRPFWQRPLLRLAASLSTRIWESGISPQQVMRGMGGWLGRKCITGYAWKRFPSCSAAERTAIGNYMYHSSAAAGSGEYALAHLLRPGAYAYAPLADRLPTIAQSRIAVDFVYGEDGVDWMNGTHADKLIASGQLPSSTRVLRVVGAGHQLIIDDPTAFAKALDSINP